MQDELARHIESENEFRSALLALKYELTFRRFLRAFDAKFNPDQPRDDWGRWTGGGSAPLNYQDTSSDNQVAAIFADLDSVPLGQRVAQLSSENESDSSASQPAGATVTYSDAVTGDSRIDGTTDRLSSTLRSVMNTFSFIPTSVPSVYGTAVHTAFGLGVKAQNLEGVEVELSYKNNRPASYGEEGSVRADVALRTITGEVIAIYDLKTGGAVLRTSRADELRSHFSASRYVPVIEFHILRGSRIKHEPFQTYFVPRPETASRLDAVRRISRCWKD